MKKFKKIYHKTWTKIVVKTTMIIAMMNGSSGSRPAKKETVSVIP